MSHTVVRVGITSVVLALALQRPAQLGFSQQHAVVSGILAHLVSQLVEYTLGRGSAALRDAAGGDGP